MAEPGNLVPGRAMDTRKLQELQPVITPQDVRAKLAVSALQRSQNALSRTDSDADGAAAARPLPPTAATAAAAPGSLDGQQLSPALLAALQKTSRELDQQGIFGPQVNQLRSKMLEQVRVYKRMQSQGRAQAATAAGTGQQPTTSAPANSLSSRLEASCLEIIASLPSLPQQQQQQQALLSTAAGAATSRLQTAAGAATSRRLLSDQRAGSARLASHAQRQRSTHRPLLHQPGGSGNQLGPAGASSSQQLVFQQAGSCSCSAPSGQPEAAPDSTARGCGSVTSLQLCTTPHSTASWLAQQQLPAGSESSCNSLGGCRSVAGSSKSQRQQPCLSNMDSSCTTVTAAASTQQQQQQQQETGARHLAGSRHLRRHLKQRDRSLAGAVARLLKVARPSSPQEQAEDSVAAAVQRRLSPAACDAFQAAVAATAEAHLRRYREKMQQAQQQLLATELQQPDVLPAAAGPASSATSEDTAKLDAALLTMQQLVALLAKRDAQPETSDASGVDGPEVLTAADGPAAQPSRIAAASLQLAVATSLPALIAAAHEHVAAAAAEFAPLGDHRLDLGRVARLKHMGKAWQKLSARSNEDGSGAGSSAAVSYRSSTHDMASSSTGSPSSSIQSTARGPGAACSTNLAAAAPGRLNTARSAAAAQKPGRAAAGSGDPVQLRQQRRESTAAGPDNTTSAAGGSDSRRTSVPASVAAGAGVVPVMRLPAPRLADPTEAELAAVPLPCLPCLLDLTQDPAKVLQARLERVWAVLGTPPGQQMQLVLSHTSRAAAFSFEATLEVWEVAAAAVLQREGILEQLMQVKAEMQAMKQQQQQYQQEGSESSVTAAGQPAAAAILSLDVRQVQQLLWAFLAATQQVALAAAMLQEANSGQQLLVGGRPYPPAGAVVAAHQLQPLLDEAWQLLGCGIIASSSK